MVSEIKIEDAFTLNYPIIDVRSPREYEKGHIPSSINIHLFSNDERAHVGTVYKQQSREKAIEVGYGYANPKLNDFISESKKVAPNGHVIIHCWRGGMRSRSFAQHLSDNGFNDVKVIVGGYKSFRNYVLNTFAIPANLNVLGGYTGSGKTHILKQLKQLGHQVIDLEGLANHKGSAFGSIGQEKQPTTEQFENNLHNEWGKLNLNEPIWIEDESHNIGSVKIPMPLFNQIRSSMLYFIDLSNEERAKHLVTEYSEANNQLLEGSIRRISKRLGGSNVSKSIDLLKENNYFEVAIIALHYYDKTYLKGLSFRNQEQVVRIPLRNTNHYENALKILQINHQHEQNKVNTV